MTRILKHWSVSRPIIFNFPSKMWVRVRLLYTVVEDAIRATKLAGRASDEQADRIAEAFSAVEGEE